MNAEDDRGVRAGAYGASDSKDEHDDDAGYWSDPEVSDLPAMSGTGSAARKGKHDPRTIHAAAVLRPNNGAAKGKHKSHQKELPQSNSLGALGQPIGWNGAQSLQYAQQQQQQQQAIQYQQQQQPQQYYPPASNYYYPYPAPPPPILLLLLTPTQLHMSCPHRSAIHQRRLGNNNHHHRMLFIHRTTICLIHPLPRLIDSLHQCRQLNEDNNIHTRSILRILQCMQVLRTQFSTRDDVCNWLSPSVYLWIFNSIQS